MDYACSTRLFHVSNSIHFFYAYFPRGLRVFSTCRLPLLLRLISTSIPRGLRVFYASFPRVDFHPLLLRLLSAWITRLFHVSTSAIFTRNFHIYSAWIPPKFRVYSACFPRVSTWNPRENLFHFPPNFHVFSTWCRSKFPRVFHVFSTWSCRLGWQHLKLV